MPLMALRGGGGGERGGGGGKAYMVMVNKR